MRTFAVLPFALVFVFGCGSLSPPNDLDVYLLCGQSNMAGRGAIDGAENESRSRRVWTFDRESRWRPADHPLHWDRPDAGVGPGLAFGIAVHERTGRPVGLVPCAVGGSPLSRWEKGGDLYAAAVDRATNARMRGRLRGVLWHQGETDAMRADLAESYGDRLTRMVADLRADLGEPELPLVVGLLGPLPAEKFPHREAVNAALAELPKRAPRVGVVSADGLTCGPDGIHLDARSARELGRRYAATIVQLE